jgi:ribosome biogenesis GTPase A
MILVGTPGMVWPKIENENDGYLLAANNSIGKNAYDEVEVAIELGEILLKNYPALLKSRFAINDSVTDSIHLLEFIARKKNFPLRKNKLDFEKAATVMLNDYRQGYLGRISLELPSI